jgi:hypothetical protein
LKIFFSGGITSSWMSGWQRYQTLKELGHEVIPFEQSRYLSRAAVRAPLRFLTHRFYHERVVHDFNRSLLQAFVASQPEVAWLEWPMIVRRETLAEAAHRLPNCRFISFQDDNPFGTRAGEQARWRDFLDAIPQYHLHFVKRQTDKVELQNRGARAVQVFRHGFYAPLFRPLPRTCVPETLRQGVSFVGSPLDHRVRIVSDLLNKHKVPMRVYGNRWNRTFSYFRNRSSFGSAVLGDDYVRVICGSRICLGFVSSSNGDEYSMRTFEVPACKGFFLAERTPTHRELFEEGQEAEFFGSVEECAEKIRFYLNNETVRDRVAERGYQRCLNSGYSLHRSVSKAMDQVQTLSE